MKKDLIRLFCGAVLIVMVGACGQQPTTSMEHSGGTPMPGKDHRTVTVVPGMDHDHMESRNSAVPYDAQFIDSMIEHHRGAITMAEQALKESQRLEIKQLVQNIIASQQQEVEQMTTWRKQWYGDLPPTDGTGMAMGDMEISVDTSKPFDQRFITAMVSHHEGAIVMAKDARTKAEHAEIKQLAEAIIKAQAAEVRQLQQWNREWFGG